MHRKLTMPLAFLALWGCAHDAAPPAAASAALPEKAPAVSNRATAACQTNSFPLGADGSQAKSALVC